MAEHLIRTDPTCNRSEGIMSKAELFGSQFQLAMPKLLQRNTRMLGSQLESFDLADPGAELAFAGFGSTLSGQFSQGRMQLVQTLASACRDVQLSHLIGQVGGRQ